MKIIKYGLLLLFLTLLLTTRGFLVNADSDPCADKQGQDKVDCYQNQVDTLSLQSKTLSNQIAQYDAQINLTTTQISQTEDKIALLGGRINELEISLNALTQAFSVRARETYKMSRVGGEFWLLVTSPDLTEAVSRFHYLQKIQEADTQLLEKLQTAQTLYQGEKQNQEDLQKQLEKQKANLALQKQDKANLLAVTQNSESKYQALLDEARAELAAVAGLGKETYLRDVSEGEKIGIIITGSSGCSTGSHLHFEIHNGDSLQDPNDYLKPSVNWSYPPGYDTGYFGLINPNGSKASWNWPIDEPIQINQGFGSHGYATIAYSGGIHTGIDMISNSSNEVKAVHSGKLYGGSYQCGGTLAGTLFYAKLDHGDGITTWYLHMIPQ